MEKIATRWTPTFNLPSSVVSLKVSSSGSSIPVGDKGSRVRMVGSLLMRLMNLPGLGVEPYIGDPYKDWEAIHFTIESS